MPKIRVQSCLVRVRPIAFFSLVLILTGCVSQKFPANFPSHLKPIVKAELSESRRYKVESVTDEPDRWRVDVQFLPAMPGGHCTIEISKTNNAVIRVMPGA
jgi:hypothetical protein